MKDMVGQRWSVDDRWALEWGFGGIRPQHACETRDPHEGRRRATARKGEEVETSSIYLLIKGNVGSLWVSIAVHFSRPTQNRDCLFAVTD